MAKTKTKPTKVSVSRFIAAIENETRRADAKALLKLFAKVSGWKAQIRYSCRRSPWRFPCLARARCPARRRQLPR